MSTLILKSDNEDALQQLKEHAQELNVTIEENQLAEDKTEYWSKIKAAGQKINLEELAGSLSDLNLDAAELRKKAWERKKSQF